MQALPPTSAEALLSPITGTWPLAQPPCPDLTSRGCRPTWLSSSAARVSRCASRFWPSSTSPRASSRLVRALRSCNMYICGGVEPDEWYKKCSGRGSWRDRHITRASKQPANGLFCQPNPAHTCNHNICPAAYPPRPVQQPALPPAAPAGGGQPPAAAWPAPARRSGPPAQRAAAPAWTRVPPAQTRGPTAPVEEEGCMSCMRVVSRCGGMAQVNSTPHASSCASMSFTMGPKGLLLTVCKHTPLLQRSTPPTHQSHRTHPQRFFLLGVKGGHPLLQLSSSSQGALLAGQRGLIAGSNLLLQPGQERSRQQWDQPLNASRTAKHHEQLRITASSGA